MSLFERWFGPVEPDGAAPRGAPERIECVQRAIDELAPTLEADGGSIEIVEVSDDGWVFVRLRGACAHCHVSDMTLHGALAPKLRSTAEWFRGVRNV